jgi:hypothetical protein
VAALVFRVTALVFPVAALVFRVTALVIPMAVLVFRVTALVCAVAVLVFPVTVLVCHAPVLVSEATVLIFGLRRHRAESVPPGAGRSAACGMSFRRLRYDFWTSNGLVGTNWQIVCSLPFPPPDKGRFRKGE